MIKRRISQKDYQLFEKELGYFKTEGKLTSYQVEDILNSYEVIGGLNFIRVLLTVGAFLLGIGVLSFVASNWMYMGKTMKFLLIIFSIIGVNIAGLRMEEKHPKTARTMHYIGVLFFGAGIFLVGQMFNLGGEYYNAFLVWTLGILPIGYVLKDKLILIFGTILLFTYVNVSYADNSIIPYLMFVIIPILYMLNKAIHYSKTFTFFINGLSIQLLLIILFDVLGFDDNSIIVGLLIIFAVGLGMLFIPVYEKIQPIFKLQGHIIHATTGIMLTFPYVWEHTSFGEHFNILFAIIYFIFVLSLIKKGSLFSIIILTALIFRFYIDLSYDFLPKSMVFIVGGFILIAFGYYFEKQRKKGRGLK